MTVPQPIAIHVNERVAGSTTMQPSELPSTVIALHHVSVWYGATQAIRNVTLDVPSHRVTALIGPSGCGKSTLIRCFNRLNDLIEHFRLDGTILLGGHDINDPSLDVTALRKRVGMVFQKSTPFPKTIYENVAYGLRVAGERRPYATFS